MSAPSAPAPRLVIAVDGPSGSGKSSTSRGVAERLGLAYLDTGAMYRAATWWVLQSGADLDDAEQVAAIVADADFSIGTDPTAPTFAIAGHDVTDAIREPGISARVSRVAAVPRVREALIARQRALIAAAEGGIVAEGRDITTVVAPDADVRVLLVADPQARVARRHAELGDRVVRDDVTDQVLRRDRDDARNASFTEAAPGVEVVDSTELSLAEVIDAICALAERTDRTTGAAR